MSSGKLLREKNELCSLYFFDCNVAFQKQSVFISQKVKPLGNLNIYHYHFNRDVLKRLKCVLRL